MSDKIEHIENRINDLMNIDNWNEKIVEIKSIKNDIDIENNNINNFLSNLDAEIISNKEYDIDKIINNFSKYELSKKIRYYQYLNKYINNMENELFDIQK